MVLSIMVPHFPDLGSGGEPPLPPIILMSAPLITQRSQMPAIIWLLIWLPAFFIPMPFYGEVHRDDLSPLAPSLLII